MSNMTQTRKPNLTAAKAQRAISALVAVMQTGTVPEQGDLDRACDAIRRACEREGVAL